MEDMIIIEDLEVWPNDLGEMTWDEATQKVEELGDGWRLPTAAEFTDTLYPNRNKLGFDTESSYWNPNRNKLGFDTESSYWSSKEFDNYYSWSFTFYNGYASYYYYGDKSATLYVRAVRDFTGEEALEYLLKDF